MSYGTHIDATCTRWRRRIGCLKLLVIFRKRATKYRALLRTMTCKDKASYDSTPLCNRYEYVVSFWNESCCVYEWVMAHMWTRGVIYTNESCLVYINESCIMYEWVMAHTGQALPIAASCGTRMNASCCVYEWVMAHIWTRGVRDTNESCLTSMRQISYVNTSWHTYGCDEWYVRMSSCLLSMSHVSCVVREWIVFHLEMSHVSYVNESCFTCKWVIFRR